MFLRWFARESRLERAAARISFTGSFWAYLGWILLSAISVITIIGWAWVYVARMRWICRNIDGTQRESSSTATGLEFLWRSLVTRDRLRLHHPDSVDVPLDDAVARVADASGRRAIRTQSV